MAKRHGRRRCGGTTVCVACFGVGLLTWSVLPAKALVFVLAAALIACGLTCARR